MNVRSPGRRVRFRVNHGPEVSVISSGSSVQEVSLEEENADPTQAVKESSEGKEEENVTLPDDAWQDTFDKLLNNRPILREENIIKKNVRASFNMNSSYENSGASSINSNNSLKETVPRSVDNSYYLLIPEVKNRLGKRHLQTLRPTGAHNRRNLHLRNGKDSISTPLAKSLSFCPFKCGLSPIRNETLKVPANVQSAKRSKGNICGGISNSIASLAEDAVYLTTHDNGEKCQRIGVNGTPINANKPQKCVNYVELNDSLMNEITSSCHKQLKEKLGLLSTNSIATDKITSIDTTNPNENSRDGNESHRTEQNQDSVDGKIAHGSSSTTFNQHSSCGNKTTLHTSSGMEYRSPPISECNDEESGSGRDEDINISDRNDIFWAQCSSNGSLDERNSSEMLGTEDVHQSPAIVTDNECTINLKENSNNLQENEDNLMTTHDYSEKDDGILINTHDPLQESFDNSKTNHHYFLPSDDILNINNVRSEYDGAILEANNSTSQILPDGTLQEMDGDLTEIHDNLQASDDNLTEANASLIENDRNLTESNISSMKNNGNLSSTNDIILTEDTTNFLSNANTSIIDTNVSTINDNSGDGSGGLALKKLPPKRSIRWLLQPSASESELFHDNASTSRVKVDNDSSVDTSVEYIQLKPGKWRKSLLLQLRRRSVQLQIDSSADNSDLSVEEMGPKGRRKQRYSRNSMKKRVTSGYGQRKSMYLPGSFGDEGERKTSLRLTRSRSMKIESFCREELLRRCNQRRVQAFEKVYDEEFCSKCRKIGEGTYGEVFLYSGGSSAKDTRVLKIIPVEGQQLINDEKQKTLDEIFSEVIISMELSNLQQELKRKRRPAPHFTMGFVKVNKIKYVVGKYPSILLNLWQQYDDEKCSENENPACFKDDQQFIVIELDYGGQDLESFLFHNAKQSYSALLQIVATLAVGEVSFQFEHRDLHWGNVLLRHTNEPHVNYRLNSKEFHVHSEGVQVTIIDYTLSRLMYKENCYYNDLANDEELFMASGDYQFDIYRMMRKRLNNKWESFMPKTNIFWMSYIATKLIDGVHYKDTRSSEHLAYLDKLHEFHEKILSFDSCVDWINGSNNFDTSLNC